MRPSLRSFVLVACLAGAPPALAGQFLVAPPFSLQDSVGFALSNLDKTDTIFVNPGNYNEKIVIDFTGTNQTALFIVRNTATAPTIKGGIEIKNARLVTIEGFKIESDQADAQAAVKIDATVGAAIVDCAVKAGDFGGVDATDTFEVIVNQCTMSGMDMNGGDGGFGVRIRGACAHKILASKFNDEEARGVDVEADRCEIRDSSASGCGGDAGIFVAGMVNLVRECTVDGNDDDGIKFVGVCDVNSNTIRDNGNTGIRCGLGDVVQFHGGVLRENVIERSGNNGIVVDDDQEGLEIKNNVLTSNQGAGVKIKGNRASVRSNTIQKTETGSSGGNGILIDAESAGSCLRENVFKGNAGAAIRVEGDDNYLFLNAAKDGDPFLLIAGGTGNAGRANTTSGTNDFP